MAGFFARLFGSGSKVLSRYVGHWCETPIKFSNKIQTPLGSKVTKVRTCVDIWYSASSDRIVVERVQMSRSGGSLASNRLNVATMRGEAFYVDRICDEIFLKQAVESDLKDDANLRKRMLAKWREEHGSESE